MSSTRASEPHSAEAVEQPDHSSLATPTSPRRTAVNLGGLLTLGVLLGLLTYGLLYQVAVGFYGWFGVAPREVGYAQQEVVADASVFIVAWVGLLGVLYVPMRLVWQLTLPLRRRWRARADSRRIVYASLQALALLVGLLGVLFTLLAGSQLLRDEGLELAVAVQAAEPGTGLDAYTVQPVLPGVNATLGEARWTVAPLGEGSTDVRRSAVTLFGNREGLAVFYDHCTAVVRRVPVGLFSLVDPVEVAVDDPEANLFLGPREGVVARDIAPYCLWVQDHPSEQLPDEFPLSYYEEAGVPASTSPSHSVAP